MTTKRKLNNEVQINDFVKISNGKERFWVKVIDLKKNLVLGIVSNNLIFNNELNMGDLVKFEKKYILEIL
jgi:uncharacterized protein YegJ (DUF2314 family)